MAKKKHVGQQETSADKNVLSLRNVLLFWLVLLALGFIFGGAGVGFGLLLACVISLLIWQFQVNTSWEGVVEAIKTERVSSGAVDEGHHEFRDVVYAHIKLSSGKNKKVRAYPGWKAGDKIRKAKGSFGPEKY